jgi:hypothetical protein
MVIRIPQQAFLSKRLNIEKEQFGYGGNPENNNFDSSQNPSIVNDEIYILDSYGQKLENYGLSLYYTIFEYFKYQENLSYPMEFETTPIDERVKLYNRYTDSRYQEFIDEAKKIFNKYSKENCNPKNKHILLESDECKFPDDSHALGGYECGDDGKWTKKCVPYYCEIGCYFDIIKEKCVLEPCNNPENKRI